MSGQSLIPIFAKKFAENFRLHKRIGGKTVLNGWHSDDV